MPGLLKANSTFSAVPIVLDRAYLEAWYALLALPRSSVGSAKIRVAASAVPDIQVYRPLLPSRSSGRKALAS